MKRYVQAALTRLGLYQRVKASRAYDLYWRIADRRILDARDQEIAFYRRLLDGLQPGDVIFDVGANHGAKTDIFLRLGARVIAVEPDEVNGRVLEQKFLKYRLARKPLVIVNKALSDTNSIETMWIDAPGSAKNTLSRKWVDTLRGDESRFGQRLKFSERREVITTTLEQLVREHGRPFFVKIDVEGSEPSVLRGLARAVPFLSFEVNLPEFRPEGLECVSLLSQLDKDGSFNYVVECGDGLVLNEWVDASECLRLIEQCGERSIEVFWKASGERRFAPAVSVATRLDSPIRIRR
jgi:FkbM family methyltransferase